MESEVKCAVNRAWEFSEQLQKDLDEGRITEDEWYQKNNALFTKAYVASENPRGQSGHTGDEEAYRYTQGMILEAIHKSGSFLDVGCANGHLMEKLAHWLGGTGIELGFYGLDISEGLVDLAKRRLPQWADRFNVGNALHWIPSKPFTFVCVKESDYVPRTRHRQFAEWGCEPSGYCTKSHQRYKNLHRRLLWFDKGFDKAL